jgi:IclR family acetate operon transcriptional repressor
MDNTYTLQTVERAIFFLEHVGAADSPPNVKDLSKALDLNITTCYHLLRTLMAHGYIERDEDGGLRLGEGVSRLARGYRRARSVEEELSDVVKRLSASTLETSFLSVREGDKVVLKVLVEGTQNLRVAGLYVGFKGDEHRRASGKAVLAHLDDADRTSMLNASLAETPDRQRKAVLKSLEKELPQTAARGWSADDGQTEHGILGIGAPVFSASGAVLGAIGISAPIFRMDKSQGKFLDLVMAAAAEATRLLAANADA